LDEVKISIIEEENPSKIKQLVGNTQVRIQSFNKRNEKNIFRLEYSPSKAILDKNKVNIFFSHATRNE
jgi:hypothetical protein